ncbi:hypothetical protein TWF173_002980 [Orbilia oligospora]|uniref:Uncharacterized protein n=1 Tax=Arthrobotrys oligospora (strain ATCC 24927 / CBS 115.81 / DSM 1491) TaxID=756982 RepID=G1XIH2_ARTOA|nr:hypothetical protein AOL_s00097g149 [Orbilia oligospora ATCC 24927]EGX47103.1 hypothetical protein AOL_s00097g149 [Orbilia oligospora ATCC 24927]KAF3315779.1 hypothetical protein TWF173_002980 [Orbilia oligospora]
MPCQQSNEFCHEIIFAIKTRRTYGTILMTVEGIEPQMACQVETALSSQSQLKGEYKFFYDELSKVIRLDLPLPDELSHGGRLPPYRRFDISNWPWIQEEFVERPTEP